MKHVVSRLNRVEWCSGRTIRLEFDVATVEERMTTLETEFRTELRHLATKEDLANLRWQLGGLIIVATGIIVATLRFWS